MGLDLLWKMDRSTDQRVITGNARDREWCSLCERREPAVLGPILV